MAWDESELTLEAELSERIGQPGEVPVDRGIGVVTQIYVTQQHVL